jgi:hypothetical protein
MERREYQVARSETTEATVTLTVLTKLAYILR